MELDRMHTKVLKQSSRRETVYDYKKYDEIIDYLISNKLIDFEITKTDKGTCYRVKTNQKGKAVLYERTTANRRANIAIVISVIAIVISFLTAFTPFSDWSRAFIETLFQ